MQFMTWLQLSNLIHFVFIINLLSCNEPKSMWFYLSNLILHISGEALQFNGVQRVHKSLNTIFCLPYNWLWYLYVSDMLKLHQPPGRVKFAHFLKIMSYLLFHDKNVSISKIHSHIKDQANLTVNECGAFLRKCTTSAFFAFIRCAARIKKQYENVFFLFKTRRYLDKYLRLYRLTFWSNINEPSSARACIN